MSLRGQLLHQELVWVENIRTPAALQRWAEFVRQYEKAARRADLDRQAMFLLEYAGPAREIPGLEPVRYALGEYDCHVFCLEAAGELEGPDWLRQYMAELALRLGGGDPERCAALLAVGEALARDPLTAAADLPDPMEREDAESAVRRAQIVQVFPVLEEYRMELIDRRRELLEDRLCRSPRVLDSEGKPVTEVQELEIAALELKKPRLTEKTIKAWLNSFRIGDVEDPDFQTRLLDTFVARVEVKNGEADMAVSLAVVLTMYRWMKDASVRKRLTDENHRRPCLKVLRSKNRKRSDPNPG